MAYQQPVLYYLHSLKVAGLGAVTTDVAAAAGFPVERLLDDRTKAKFKFSTSAANHHITVDRGATTPDSVHRIIIPAGHNLGLATYSAESSAEPASWPGTVLTSGTFSAGTGTISFGFGPATTARHLRLRFTSTGQYELGELIWTNSETISVGISPDFDDHIEGAYSEATTKGQESYRTLLGSTRRVIEVEWPYLDTAADVTIINELVAATNGGVDSFWFLGPDTTKARIPVKLVEPIRTPNASSNPSGTGIVPGVKLSMVEALE